jgi:TonB family protein
MRYTAGKSMKRHHFFLLLLFGLALVPRTALPEDNPEDALKAQLNDKVLILLHPSGEESLQFNADGSPANSQPPGPWTIFGGVHIRKVRLQPDRLHLEGQRVFYFFEAGHLAAFDFNLVKNRKESPCQPFVDIEIRLDQPLGSASQAQAILAKIFAFSKKDFVESLPDLWRAYAIHNFEIDSASPGGLRFLVEETLPREKKRHEDNKPENSSPAKPGDPAAAGTPSPVGPFKIGNGVSAPRAKSTPDPVYSQAARYEKYQGKMVVSAIVNKEGNMEKIEVVRPLGLGLDEQAAVQMKTWRFDPAKRDGDPVAVAMHVEVKFQLY